MLSTPSLRAGSVRETSSFPSPTPGTETTKHAPTGRCPGQEAAPAVHPLPGPPSLRDQEPRGPGLHPGPTVVTGNGAVNHGSHLSGRFRFLTSPKMTHGKRKDKADEGRTFQPCANIGRTAWENRSHTPVSAAHGSGIRIHQRPSQPKLQHIMLKRPMHGPGNHHREQRKRNPSAFTEIRPSIPEPIGSRTLRPGPQVRTLHIKHQNHPHTDKRPTVRAKARHCP